MAASSHNSTLEDMLIMPQQEQRNNNNNSSKANAAGNKPQPEQSLKCPRCDSTNTKFCYYNNYSLSQPRYFCKSCRRYWTKGGTLRNVPVGGGCRRNKRPSSSSSSSSMSLSKRPSPHIIDTQFSAVSSEANSGIPLINSFPMDLGLSHFRAGPQVRFDGPDHDVSFLGNLGLHGNIIPGFFDGIRNIGTIHETEQHTRSFQNFYHGLDIGATENISSGAWDELVPKRETTTGFDNDQNRVLWGFPWNGNSEEVDSARSGGSWNGINTYSAATNWHGLVNSPLM